MKITLPNGTVIEGSDITPEFVAGIMSGTPAKKPEPKPEQTVLLEAEVALTGSQRDALHALRKANSSGGHVSWVAAELAITEAAAGVRCRKLMEAGLAERVSKGVYRAL